MAYISRIALNSFRGRYGEYQAKLDYAAKSIDRIFDTNILRKINVPYGYGLAYDIEKQLNDRYSNIPKYIISIISAFIGQVDFNTPIEDQLDVLCKYIRPDATIDAQRYYDTWWKKYWNEYYLNIPGTHCSVEILISE